ncbi:hypothetical protein RJT34_04598 [Clitoria ternatea]|uniref:Uncharacterized protein n=1 Tax=Clitoria ternatea TaxID=43366 RepID=A0AAN9KLB6_CLITE
MEEEDLLVLHSPQDPQSLPEFTPSSCESSAITLDNNSKHSSHRCTPAPFLQDETVSIISLFDSRSFHRFCVLLFTVFIREIVLCTFRLLYGLTMDAKAFVINFDHSTTWTDQQHRLYISSLEASFVNELHRSMRLRGLGLQNNTDEAYKRRTLQSSLNMPSKSLALQDGCQKISLERVAPILESTADSHVLAGSQIGLTSIDRGCTLGDHNTNDHRLLCDEEVHARGCSTFIERSQRSFEKQGGVQHSSKRSQSPFHHDLVCRTAEVTDQNFNEEDARSSHMPMVKRLKTAAADGFGLDQIVPFGKIHTPDVSTGIDSTSEYKGHELLSEPTESYHSQIHQIADLVHGILFNQYTVGGRKFGYGHLMLLLNFLANYSLQILDLGQVVCGNGSLIAVSRRPEAADTQLQHFSSKARLKNLETQ